MGSEPDIRYIFSKFDQALSNLIAPASIQSRLAGAAMSLSVLDWPEDKKAFEPRIMASWKALEAHLIHPDIEAKGDEGTQAAACNAMSDDQAWALAKKIAEIHYNLHEACLTEELRAVNCWCCGKVFQRPLCEACVEERVWSCELCGGRFLWPRNGSGTDCWDGKAEDWGASMRLEPPHPVVGSRENPLLPAGTQVPVEMDHVCPECEQRNS